MASLVVVEGQAAGSHFPLTGPIVSFGRDDTCTFQILDQFVSRKHLQIRLDAATGRHLAGDYRSAHGVVINNKPIVLDTPLSNGDRIQIGQTTLVYLVADHPDAKAAVAAAQSTSEWKRSTMMGPR